MVQPPQNTPYLRVRPNSNVPQAGDIAEHSTAKANTAGLLFYFVTSSDPAKYASCLHNNCVAGSIRPGGVADRAGYTSTNPATETVERWG